MDMDTGMGILGVVNYWNVTSKALYLVLGCIRDPHLPIHILHWASAVYAFACCTRLSPCRSSLPPRKSSSPSSLVSITQSPQNTLHIFSSRLRLHV
ncbi:hypothetical protein EYC84_003312 [Monilinia fructicola]|uniref:Uncharacterized protein n=1 Tax=Monilinia fructicola TaxID=38448 RepID=A0A5M9JW82_MONFR|nr:hypothetical protein EYC84_003312 [Monilinia fructicola]